jgi:hypothetical protein
MRMEAGLDRLKRMVEYAETKGAVLLLENLNKEPENAEVHYLACTIDEWRYCYEKIDSPSFALSFTANHAHLLPDGIEGFVDAIPMERVAEVRLADCHRNGYEMHLVPGKGDLNFGDMFKRIEGKGFKGHYMAAYGSLDDMQASNHAATKRWLVIDDEHANRSSLDAGPSLPLRRRRFVLASIALLPKRSHATHGANHTQVRGTRRVLEIQNRVRVFSAHSLTGHRGRASFRVGTALPEPSAQNSKLRSAVKTDKGASPCRCRFPQTRSRRCSAAARVSTASSTSRGGSVSKAPSREKSSVTIR